MARKEFVTTRVAIAATATAATALLAPIPESGALGGSQPESSTKDHCVVTVSGQRTSGEYELTEAVCFGTLAEALASAGADVDPHDASLSMRDVTQDDLLAASSALATHYDGFNRTGASITVSGTTCSGGYVNLSASWINRISSTLNSCPSVYFFDGYDKTGQSESTTYNLSALNNRANSVMYA